MEKPFFLTSEIEFTEHIRELYSNLSNFEKGKKFATLSKNILSTHQDLLSFRSEMNSKQSWDRGVDIFWIDPETNKQIAYCQSKLTMKGKDDFDLIISKFHSYDDEKKKQDNSVKQLNLFNSLEKDNPDDLMPHNQVRFYITTISPVKNIENLYLDSGRPSVEFYKRLKKSNRIEIIDIKPFYKLFLEAYMKEFSIPQTVEFMISGKLVNYNNVYMGVISAADLIKIYEQGGQGIFFENVRSFLGLDVDINNEIYKTACQDPEKMLERNNGITFKASKFDYNDDQSKVILENAGIINGCQTTMCIYRELRCDRVRIGKGLWCDYLN